jgi:hypothetical protein
VRVESKNRQYSKMHFAFCQDGRVPSEMVLERLRFVRAGTYFHRPVLELCRTWARTHDLRMTCGCDLALRRFPAGTSHMADLGEGYTVRQKFEITTGNNSKCVVGTERGIQQCSVPPILKMAVCSDFTLPRIFNLEALHVMHQPDRDRSETATWRFWPRPQL